MQLNARDAEVRERPLKAAPPPQPIKPLEVVQGAVVSVLVLGSLTAVSVAGFLVSQSVGFAVLGAALFLLAFLVAKLV